MPSELSIDCFHRQHHQKFVSVYIALTLQLEQLEVIKIFFKCW